MLLNIEPSMMVLTGCMAVDGVSVTVRHLPSVAFTEDGRSS